MAFVEVPVLRGFTEIQDLFDLVSQSNGIICGGYARYCASPLKTPSLAKDVDIYPKFKESTEILCKRFLALGFEVKFENNMSITMKVKKGETGNIRLWPTPQVIKPVIEGAVVSLGSAEEILDNFDFTVTRAAIVSSRTVLVDEAFLDDEKHKRLRLKKIHCPISSTLRCAKYSKKGYWFPPSEAIKLFIDWERRDNDYRARIVELFKVPEEGKELTRKEIDELEALLRID